MDSPILLQNRYRSLVLLALVVTGLLFSRALLSILMASGILLLLFPSVRREFGTVFKRPLIFLVSGICLFYAWLLILDPGIYTLERMAFHLSIISILCLLQFMAAGSDLFLPFILSAGVLSTLPSIYDMLIHEGLAALYEKGQVAYTLMQGDHQRFTIWISGCLALSWYYRLMEHKRWAAYFILFFTVFLVVLSVRTGWLFAGLAGISGGFIYLKRQGKRTYWIWSMVIVLLILSSAFTIPFVRNKIQYMQWEWREKKEAEKAGSSDAVRRMVNESTVELIRDNPAGLGARKAELAITKRLTENYPDQKVTYQWPFNQYLKWGLSAGWLIGAIPVLLVFYMLYRLYFTRNYLTAVWVLFISLTGVYESTLEMQYGFFLSVFFTGLIYLYESGLSKRRI
jgi:hypothetical protein